MKKVVVVVVFRSEKWSSCRFTYSYLVRLSPLKSFKNTTKQNSKNDCKIQKTRKCKIRKEIN